MKVALYWHLKITLCAQSQSHLREPERMNDEKLLGECHTNAKARLNNDGSTKGNMERNGQDQLPNCLVQLSNIHQVSQLSITLPAARVAFQEKKA